MLDYIAFTDVIYSFVEDLENATRQIETLKIESVNTYVLGTRNAVFIWNNSK